jgi:hypothetical protein
VIMFFSGGGSPWTPEAVIQEPAVMLSYFVHVSQQSGNPCKRLRKAIKHRRTKTKGVKHARRA